MSHAQPFPIHVWVCLPLVLGACSQEGPNGPNPGEPIVALQDRNLELVDVALLYPLPRSELERDSGLLSASTLGRGGALLPEGVFRAVEPLRSFGVNQWYASLRVVSMRLDPCASTTTPNLSGSGCQAEVRLVLQPIFSSPNDDAIFAAGDAALHTFYSVTRQEAFALLNALVGARQANAEADAFEALGPHPVLQRQGLLGPFAMALRSALLATVGAQNFFKVAVLSGEGPNQWDFSIHLVRDAQTPVLERQSIATLSAGTQRQSLFSGFGLPDVIGQFSPEPAEGDVYKELAVVGLARTLDGEARQSQFDALVRIENPHSNTPDTVSCALCHFTQTTRELVVRPVLGLTEQDSTFTYEPNRQLLPNVNLAARFNTQSSGFQVHAFGYVGADAVIMQRTVNDSAATLEYFLSAQ
jgi:hypothetical protein